VGVKSHSTTGEGDDVRGMGVWRILDRLKQKSK